MGKPKKRRASRVSSESSFRTASSNPSSVSVHRPMSKQKKMKKKRQSYKKTQNSIRKVFDTLRQEVSTHNAIDNSHIDEVDISNSGSSSRANGNNSSLILVSDNIKKRKLDDSSPVSIKKLREDDSDNNDIIIVKDEFPDNNDIIQVKDEFPSKAALSKIPKKRRHIEASSSSIQCSTPKDRTKDMKNLIISNFPQNNNASHTRNFNKEVRNLTKEINRDSYVTIDLTVMDTLNKSASRTREVIDLAEISDIETDCTVVSVDKASLTSVSLSGESNVTVLHKPKTPTDQTKRQLKKVFSGLSKMNPTEKSKMLEYIVSKVLGGQAEVVNNQRTPEVKDASPQTTEDTYIKEVILGEKASRNSFGSNIYNPSKDLKNKTGLRMVVIDGSNVAMEHGKGKEFSVQGLKICIDYFLRRGHVVKAFVPRYRCKYGKSTNPRLLDELERRGLVVYTPSRELPQGRRITSYDDRYIVQCAAEFDGVIVSGDNYRDLMQENPKWRNVIETRLLPFTWVNNMIMFPRDPLGKNGPTLEQFLKHPDSPPT